MPPAASFSAPLLWIRLSAETAAVMVPLTFSAVRPISIKKSTLCTSGTSVNGSPKRAKLALAATVAVPGMPDIPMEAIILAPAISAAVPSVIGVPIACRVATATMAGQSPAQAFMLILAPMLGMARLVSLCSANFSCRVCIVTGMVLKLERVLKATDNAPNTFCI